MKLPKIKNKVLSDVLTRVFVGLAIVVLLVGSVFGYVKTKINYTLTEYLDPGSESMQGLKLVNEEFGGASYARVMVDDIEIVNAASLKKSLSEVEGVRYAMWLDDILSMALKPIAENSADFVDALSTAIKTLSPDAEIPPELTDFAQTLQSGSETDLLRFLDQNYIILEAIDIMINYYFDGAISLTNYYDSDNHCALIEIYFTNDDYSTETSNAIEKIQSICSDRKLSCHYDGSAVTTKATVETTLSQVLWISIVAVPLIMIILLLTTKSFMEPVIFLIVIGLSVMLNMGTNWLFVWLGWLNGISFITNGMCAALQMAISMDYAIFVLHKYDEEKLLTNDRALALKRARKHSLLPIISSCLTTVAGFAAIAFMKFGIGKDIGLVFSKGILISFACTMIFMPILIKIFDKALDKTCHKPLMPKGIALSRLVVKFAVPIVVTVLVVGVLAYTQQDNIKFIYGESSISASEGTKTYDDARIIEETFDTYNPVLIIIPKSLREYDAAGTLKNNDNEKKIIEEISAIKYNGKSIISGIMSYRSLVLPGLENAIPEEFVANFDSENYTRIVININAGAESDAAFDVYSQIRTILTRNAGEFYITGSTSATYDLKNTIESDYTTVNLLAIIAVIIIIAISFKSLLLPFLLVATIEIGVFINMAIVALAGTQIAFLGYLVVSLIQLGATIDYAILYTKNYSDYRQRFFKRKATVMAIRKSFLSISTSALILFAAGCSIGVISTVQGVVDIGLMVGRGALISGVLVLCFLPPLLMICDKYINLLTYKSGYIMPSKTEEELEKEEERAITRNATSSSVAVVRQVSEAQTVGKICAEVLESHEAATSPDSASKGTEKPTNKEDNK